MSKEILYHGTTGDNVLQILNLGALVPRDGKVFFSRHRWQDALMHGADTRRGASFVIKVAVDIPATVVRHYGSTPGVPLTLVVETSSPLSAEVMELYVRRRVKGEFETTTVRPELIRATLTGG